MDTVKLENYLKEKLQEARNEYAAAVLIEEANDYSDAMESMERKYWEGRVDALEYVMEAAGLPYEGVHEAKDLYLCCECREVMDEFQIFQDPDTDDIFCQECKPEEGGE